MYRTDYLVLFLLGGFNFVGSLFECVCGFGSILMLHILWELFVLFDFTKVVSYTNTTTGATETRTLNIFHTTVMGPEDVHTIVFISYIRSVFTQAALAFLLYLKDRKRRQALYTLFRINGPSSPTFSTPHPSNNNNNNEEGDGGTAATTFADTNGNHIHNNNNNNKEGDASRRERLARQQEEDKKTQDEHISHFTTFNKKMIAMITLPSVVGTVIGLLLINHIPEMALRIILFCSCFFYFLILICVVMFKKLENKKMEDVIKEDLLVLMNEQAIRSEELKIGRELERKRMKEKRKRKVQKLLAISELRRQRQREKERQRRQQAEMEAEQQEQYEQQQLQDNNSNNNNNNNNQNKEEGELKKVYFAKPSSHFDDCMKSSSSSSSSHTTSDGDEDEAERKKAKEEAKRRKQQQKLKQLKKSSSQNNNNNNNNKSTSNNNSMFANNSSLTGKLKSEKLRKAVQSVGSASFNRNEINLELHAVQQKQLLDLQRKQPRYSLTSADHPHHHGYGKGSAFNESYDDVRGGTPQHTHALQQLHNRHTLLSPDVAVINNDDKNHVKEEGESKKQTTTVVVVPPTTTGSTDESPTTDPHALSAYPSPVPPMTGNSSARYYIAYEFEKIVNAYSLHFEEESAVMVSAVICAFFSGLFASLTGTSAPPMLVFAITTRIPPMLFKSNYAAATTLPALVRFLFVNLGGVTANNEGSNLFYYYGYMSNNDNNSNSSYDLFWFGFVSVLCSLMGLLFHLYVVEPYQARRRLLLSAAEMKKRKHDLDEASHQHHHHVRTLKHNKNSNNNNNNETEDSEDYAADNNKEKENNNELLLKEYFYISPSERSAFNNCVLVVLLLTCILVPPYNYNDRQNDDSVFSVWHFIISLISVIASGFLFFYVFKIKAEKIKSFDVPPPPPNTPTTETERLAFQAYWAMQNGMFGFEQDLEFIENESETHTENENNNNNNTDDDNNNNNNNNSVHGSSNNNNNEEDDRATSTDLEGSVSDAPTPHPRLSVINNNRIIKPNFFGSFNTNQNNSMFLINNSSLRQAIGGSSSNNNNNNNNNNNKQVSAPSSPPPPPSAQPQYRGQHEEKIKSGRGGEEEELLPPPTATNPNGGVIIAEQKK